MMDNQQPRSNIGRYLAALAFIIGFILLALYMDHLIGYIILKFYPQFTMDIQYVSDFFNFVIGAFGCYIIYKILMSVVNAHERKVMDIGSSEVMKLILRTLLYVSLFFLVLYTFGQSLGISLTQLLAGSAIGGIVIGLAVQTIATSILSGFIISSSKTLVPGEIMNLHSSVWGGDMICRVSKVNVLFTEVITQNGNKMKIPNTALFSSTTFTKLRSGDSFSYTIPVSINADVSVTEFDKKVREELSIRIRKIQKVPPKIYLSSRGQSVDTFSVIICFNDYSEINELLDVVNKTFDDVYWNMKNSPLPKKKRRS
jgi:small-conductance mechanosensitive channel